MNKEKLLYKQLFYTAAKKIIALRKIMSEGVNDR